jgi:hypothetical protein
LAHDRDCQPNGEFTGASAKAATSLCHDNSSFARGHQVDVIRVVARLRDNPKVWELLE